MNIIRVHLASNTRILVAVRPNAEDAAELVNLLNTHAVGYQFRVEAVDVYHAEDCGGSCSGYGYISEDGLWHSGPTPAHLAARQQALSEGWDQ